MTWVLAIAIVLLVFKIGQVSEVAKARRVAAKAGRDAAIEALKKIDRTGSSRKVHEVAAEMAIESVSDPSILYTSRLDFAKVVIQSYRDAFPKATMRVAYEEKLNG